LSRADLHRLDDVDSIFFQMEFPASARNVENVVDEFGEMFAAIPDIRHILPVSRRTQRPESFAFHECGKADDGVEGRTQFVADDGQERRLGFVRGLGLLGALLQRDLLEALLQPRKRFERVQGLEEIIEGTAAERFDGVLDLGPRRDDDADYIGKLPSAS
jgi:hypothetical protein